MEKIKNTFQIKGDFIVYPETDQRLFWRKSWYGFDMQQILQETKIWILSCIYGSYGFCKNIKNRWCVCFKIFMGSLFNDILLKVKKILKSEYIKTLCLWKIQRKFYYL